MFSERSGDAASRGRSVARRRMLNNGAQSRHPRRPRCAPAPRRAARSIADLLGAPIAKALLGKAILPDDHPHVTGGIGYLGARPSQQVFAECDTLLVVGSSFPYIEYYPTPDQVSSVQIDLDAASIGLRFPVDVGLAADAAASLRALNAQLATQRRIAASSSRHSDGKQSGTQRSRLAPIEPGTPMKPERVVRDLECCVWRLMH